MKWQDVLRNSVSKESIKASTLRKIPQLKACPYWERAVFLGTLTYKLKFANYDGGLVKYDGKDLLREQVADRGPAELCPLELEEEDHCHRTDLGAT